MGGNEAMKAKTPDLQSKSSVKLRGSSLLVLSAACISLFGCDLSGLAQKKTNAVLATTPSSGSQTGGGGSPTNNAPPAPSAPVEVPVNISSTGTAGIRDFVAVVPAMSAVTGIPISNNNVRNYYYASITRMSVDGSGTAVSSALLATYTTMASVFCWELDNQEAGGTKNIFAALDFSKGTDQLTPAVRTALLNKLTQQFWGRLPTATEATTFNTMLDEVSAALATVGGNYNNNYEKTKMIALSSCTAILSSLEFLKN